MPDVDNPNPFPLEETAKNIIPAPASLLEQKAMELTNLVKQQEDNQVADRVVHVEIAFVVHGTVAQAEQAGRKVVHDIEVMLHREISSDVWVSEPMPEETPPPDRGDVTEL